MIKKVTAVLIFTCLVCTTIGVKGERSIEEDFDPLVDVSVAFRVEAIRFLEYTTTFPELIEAPDLFLEVSINNETFTAGPWEQERRVYDLGIVAEQNVPDDVEWVEIRVQVFDNDSLCDLSSAPDRGGVRLNYSIRTGEWHGDDQRGDLSGYGRLNGCDDGSLNTDERDIELFFSITQSDADEDGLTYYKETEVYGTDPLVNNSGQDADEDGIPIEWEAFWGYDPFVADDHRALDPDNDGLDNWEEYRTSQWGSDPFRRDLFCEVDQMELGPNDTAELLTEETFELLRDRYDTHNIVAHYDDGRMGGGDIIPFDALTGIFELYRLYDEYFLGDEENHWRRGVFHYGLVINNHLTAVAHAFVGEGSIINSNVKGINSYQFSRKDAEIVVERTSATHDFVYASYIMHETGHSLGIDILNPLGCDNFLTLRPWRFSYHLFANYQSIMNYRYCHHFLDYSDGSHGWLDHDDWSNLDFTWFEPKE